MTDENFTIGSFSITAPSYAVTTAETVINEHSAIEMNCDVCGRNLTEIDETGNETTTEAIRIKLNEEVDKAEAIQRFGKTDFSICSFCWLKSLGVKVDKYD